MNTAETEEIASIQYNAAVQVPNMVEISTVDSRTVTDLTIVPGIITTTSEATAIPQNHTTPTLENDTTALGETTRTAGHGDDVTFGNNRISISNDSSKSTSGDVVGPHWEISTVTKDAILDPPRNVDSTASENISSKEHVTKLSSGDNVTYAIKEAKTVLENITTVDACYTAPGNMATDEDNPDSTIIATPEVHFIPTIVLEDVCSAPVLREMGPVSGDMSNVTSEEKLNNSVSGDAFSAFSVGGKARPATSLGSTAIFVDTNRNKATSSPEDYTTDKGAITVVPATDINSADPFSDPGEVFQTSFKETYPIGSEAITVLSESITDKLSTVDTSTISNTFSAMFQLPSTVVSGNMISLSDDNNIAVEGLYTTSGSESRPIKTDSDSIEVSCSLLATTITSLENLSNASTDSNLNFSENMALTASVESTQYVSTTGNGNTFAIIVGENATTSGNTTAIHSETAPFNEPVSVIPRNVTSIASARDTTTANPKNMAIGPGHMQTMPAMGITTNPENASIIAGETATILSSGDVIMTTIPSKEAILDSENSTITMTPSSIRNPKAASYITDTGCGDSTTREDTIADAPGNANQMENAYGEDTSVNSGEILSTALIKTFDETTAIVSFQENTSNFMPAGAKPTATQGNTFGNINKNVNNCGSSVVSESVIGTTSDNNTTIGDKATNVGLGDIIVSATGETDATSQNIISPVRNYVTTVFSNQDIIGTSDKREPPKTITGKTTTGFRDATTIPGDTYVTDTIPTYIIASFDSKAPSDAIVLVSGDVTATSGPATNISLFSREIKTNALEDATSTSTSDLTFINIANNEGMSFDMPEEICCGKRVSSVHNEATTILGHISTADSSFSTGTSIQETNTNSGGIITSYTTNIPEGTQPREVFACLHSEISAGSEDVSNFSETNIFDACTTAEIPVEKVPTGDAANSTGANDIWCESPICPITIGTQNITDAAPLNISLTPAISVASESSTIPELAHAKHTITPQGIYIAFATGDTANVTTSVDSNKTNATKSREVTVSETPSASGDFAHKTTLLRDVTTTATGTTATVITLGNTLMTTQAFSDGITTVSGDKSTTILEKTPKPGENMTSENIAPAILGDTSMHGEILLCRTRSPGDILILEDACDLVVPKESCIPKETLSSDPSGYGTTIITKDSSVTADTINTLNDTFSAHDNITFMPHITISSEKILTSSNDSITIPVGISIQHQTSTTEVPMGIPDKASFATGENATTITLHEARAVHSITGDATVTDTAEGMFTTVSSVTDPVVSPRNASATASIPCDTTTSALGETLTIEERFSSGKVNSMTTPLGEASTKSCSLTESITSTGSFSILSNVIHGNAESINESVTSNLDTTSTLDISRLPETNSAVGSSMRHTKHLQGTNMPAATADIIGAMTSMDIFQDHSVINFAPADDTMPRTNINDFRRDIAINAAKYSHNISEASVISAGDYTTGTHIEKYIITATKPSGDITTIAGDTASVPGDNATDVDVPRDTATTLVLEDIHTTTIGETDSPFRKVSGSILEFTSTQCETSVSGHIRSNEETSMFETPSTPMVNLATKETFGIDLSKAVMNPGEMTADEVTNTENYTITACRRNSTSASRDSISNPESITTSGETLMSGQITTAILEDTGNQNVSSVFKIITFPGETAKTAVNFMAGMNIDTNASNVTSRPCTPKEDAILRDTIAHVIVTNETVLSQRQINSPKKSTDVSSSPTYLDDSILESSSVSRQITHPLSTVTSVPYSGGTAKDVPNVETKDGIAEIQTPEITTSPEETLLPCIIIASKEVNLMAITSNTGPSLTSGMPVISEKCAIPEATHGEITSLGGINTPEETFASKGAASFIEAPISSSVSDTSLASTYEVTISQADISILDNTFSSIQTAASQNSSASKCFLLPANEDTTAITTNSTSSPGDITPGDSGRPDEEITPGNVVNININFGSETLNPEVIPDPAELLIVEEIATNASGDSNTPESTVHFPENAATTLAEDAAIVFGNNSTTSENPVNSTTLDKSNYNSTRDTLTTTQGTFNTASEKTTTIEPKGTTDDNMTENSACNPWQLKTAPEDNLVIVQEQSTIVTSGKVTDASTDTSVSVSGELSATSERILTAISEVTNIALPEETMDPSIRGLSIVLDDTVEISLGEMTIAISYDETPENTDTTGDVMDQSDTTTYEDDSTASEDTLIDVSCSENTTEATTKEPATSVDEATTIIHRNTSKTLRVTMSDASPARSPTTASAKAITIHREGSPGVATGNVPIDLLPKETFKAVSKKISSMFQGKNNILNPVASLPYWFILFLGILLMMVLVVVGLCMVI